MHTFQFQDMLMLIGVLGLIVTLFGGVLLLCSKILRLVKRKKASMRFGTMTTLDLVLEQNVYLHRMICDSEEQIKALRQEMLKLNNKFHLANEKKDEK